MSAHVSALMKNETVSWIRSRVRSSSPNVSWTLWTPCWFLWINQSFFQAKISTSWKMWKCTLWVFLSHICHRRNNKLFSSFIDSSSLFHDAKIMCFFSRRENPYETFLQILIIKALWSSKLTWHLNFSQQFMDLICRFLTDFGVFPETTCGFWHIKKEQHCCCFCCWTTTNS